jgi:predicted  nucleic acid-binding Zn-ribbon protein/N-acetylneuraminic acid mutarotase
MSAREVGARVWCVVIACMFGVVAVSCTASAADSETIEISTNLPPLPFERLGAGTVLGDDGCIYVFGGYRYNYSAWDTTTNMVMIYNITTGVTSYGTSMAHSVAWPSCAKLPDGRIVVIGGYDSSVSNGTKNVRIFSPKTNSWTTNASAPTNISKASSVLGNDGKVYVFGPSGSDNSTLIYDPVGDAWSYGADLPGGRSRYSSSAVKYNDTAIYVIGGHHMTWIWLPPSTWIPMPTDTNYVDIYNPVTDSWTNANPLNTVKHSGGAAIAKDGRIHYYGGQQWLGFHFDTIETLDVSVPGASWQVSNSTVSKEKAHFGTVADEYGRVFLVGGMEYPAYRGIAEVEMLITAEVSEVNEITISSPMDGTGVNGTVEISVEVKNQHLANVVVVDAYVDDVMLESQLGGGATSWTFVWDAAGLDLDSSHDVLVRAFFDDGSVSEDAASYTIVTATTDDTIEERLSQIEENLTAALLAISNLTLNIDELENLTDTLLENLSTLQDDLDSIRDDIQEDLSSVQADIAEIQSQLDSLAESLAELESTTATDLSNLSADVTALSAALDSLTTMVADLQAALDGLAQQPGLDLDEVIDELESLRDALEDLNQTVDEVDESGLDLDEVIDELESLRDALEDLNQTVDEVDESVGEAQEYADDAGNYAMLAMAVALVVLAVLSIGVFLQRRKP